MSEKGGSDLDVFKTVSKPPAAPRKKTLLGMQAPPGLGLPPLPPAPGSARRSSYPVPNSQPTQRGLPPPPPPSRRSVPSPSGPGERSSVTAGLSSPGGAPRADVAKPDVSAAPAEEAPAVTDMTPEFDETTSNDGAANSDGDRTTSDDKKPATAAAVAGDASDEEPAPLCPPVGSASADNQPDYDDDNMATELFSTAAVATADRASSEVADSRATKPGLAPPGPAIPTPGPPSEVSESRRLSPAPPKPVTRGPARPAARLSDPDGLPPPSLPPGMLTAPRGLKSIPPISAPPPSTASNPRASAPPGPPASADGWDEDDKTEIYSRSAGQDAARRLLGTTTPRTSAVPDVPPPPMSRPSAPVPTPPTIGLRRGAMIGPAHITSGPKSIPPVLSQNRKPLMLSALLSVLLLGALYLVLRPTTGNLAVTVAGPGNRPIDAVEVLVDKQVRCTESPCQIADLPDGTHYVRARAAGYQDTAETAVLITGGSEAVRNFTLLPATGTGFRVKAAGTGLKLFVDGREVGPLPQELKDLSAGEHLVKVAGEHFETWEQKVQVKADEMQTIGPLKLKVVKGLAMIKDGGNASGARIVLQSGDDRRSLPKLPINLHIDTSKPHTLIATKSGFETFRQDLEFEAGQAERTFEITLTEREKSKEAALRPRSTPRVQSPPPKPAAVGTGTLNFNTIPASKILLDGRPIGDTPKTGVSVSAGRHGVVFLHGENRVSKSVSVNAGESKTVTHRF